jgi:hypothetical protein
MIFLLCIGVFFLIYSEIKFRERNKTHVVTTSDAMFYHEYIAVHLFGMEPYIPRDQKPVIKYSMGMAVTYLPAITVGYVYTEFKGVSHDFGRNYIYQKLLYYLGFIYCFIGLFYLRKVLKNWCNDWVVMIVLGILFFGTNLYYYVRVEPLMSHATSFAFVIAFFYYSFQFIKQQKLRYAAGMGIFLALVTLIRPVNIILALIPFTIWLTENKSWSEKFNFIMTHWKYWILIGLCVFLAFIPQMVYWHHYTGQWFYYSYRHENFLWSKPAILQILFSFRKGLFIYTPMMIFIIPGMIILYKKNKPVFWALLVFFCINVYVISCWWCWWYGGSFGMRPMIDSYGLMAIWIGLFIQFLWDKSKPILIFTIAIMGFLVYVNLFQTRQARICWIHYDSMTWQAYKVVFLNNERRNKLTEEQWNAMLSMPDYDYAKYGKRFW